MFIFERDNGQWVLVTNTMALCRLSCAWRIFVPICSLITIVETLNVSLCVHAIVFAFVMMNLRRITIMVTTTLGTESQIGQQVEGRSEGKDGEAFGRGL